MAPGRVGAARADSEKRQRGLLQDRLRHLQRRQHHDGRERVGQPVAHEDPCGADAHRARSLEEVLPPQREDLGRHHAGVAPPAGEAEHEDNGDQARPSAATKARASRIWGNDHVMSTMVMITVSARPPTKPLISPSVTPTSTLITTASTPTSSEMRAPWMMRLRTSRPT